MGRKGSKIEGKVFGVSKVKNPLYFISIIVCCIFFSGKAVAADSFNIKIADSSASDTLAKKPRTRVFIASPTITYAPETRFAAGIFALYYFRLSRDTADTRASSIDLSFKYTQNKQLIIEPTWKIFSKKDKYALMGEGMYQDFREYFYGIGNDAPKEQEELYSFKMWKFDSRLQRRVFDKLFIGPHYHFQYMYNVSPTEGRLLDEGNITGAAGGVASGLGVAVTLDYRSSVLSPVKGYYLDFSNVYFVPSFGSDFTFSSYAFDARKYFQVFPRHILAFQGYFKHLSGDPPFRMLSLVGGPQLMRGYYLGRYRDRNFLAAQAEYRFPVFWRFGLAGFVSAGEVAHKLNEFDTNGLHYGYGLGLRFLVNKKENLNIRLDVGFGEDSPGIYATVGEAF